MQINKDITGTNQMSNICQIHNNLPYFLILSTFSMSCHDLMIQLWGETIFKTIVGVFTSWILELPPKKIKDDNQGTLFLPHKVQFQRRKCPPSHHSVCLK